MLDPHFAPWSATMIDKLVELDSCDGYVVLVHDPQTNEADAHGPYDGIAAADVADRFRRDFDTAGLSDVQITVTRLHRSPMTGTDRAA
jgi:hypothetical protein